ncbi:MAG: NADPH:quinone oxidoreductase family protein [Planctomycetales bacterium]
MYQTSYCGLVTRGGLKAGETLLVHAGASGVGMAAIQIGKALGAKVIATCGSAAKQEFCKKIGADEALNYTDPAWVDRVNEITKKRGADVIYDPVGGDVCDLSLKCIASGGRLLIIGFTSGKIPNIPANRILLKSMSVVGVFWGRMVKENPRYPHEVHQALLKLGVKPVVSKEYPLAEALQAMQAVAQREVLGKIVLSMPE